MGSSEMEEKNNEDVESSPPNRVDKLIALVDQEFKEGFWEIRAKHSIVDLIFTVLVIIIAIIVGIVLWFLQTVIPSAPESTHFPLVLSGIAVFLSLMQMLMKWSTTPAFDVEGYAEDVVKRNCKEISERHNIPNDLLLYAVVVMKSERPSVKLAEVRESAEELFTESRLISRLYYGKV